jgi:pyridinium-3,5-bisthiocarboxylic acid mononucleotide nickel chelatase
MSLSCKSSVYFEDGSVMRPTHNRIIYIEPFSGISGDMMLGALLDLGVDFARLQERLKLLPIGGYRLEVKKCMRSGIQATKFDVQCEPGASSPHNHHHHSQNEAHQHHGFADIRVLIESSALSSWVKEKSIEAFRRLAEAEGKIHAQPAEKVHFHEVGAIDSIVDIVGSMIAIEELLPARFLCSAVNVGQGTLECRHGTYPVPGPAAQELLTGIPTYSNSVQGELTTPTGAALLATLVDSFACRPAMIVRSSGYGAGSRETPGNANVLRLTLGEETLIQQTEFPGEQVAVIESTIDDMNPQVYGFFQEKALAEGALDVYATPIQMKKNRPGLKITVVCALHQIEDLTQLIFRETTTIGVRCLVAQRSTLPREFQQVWTEFGEVKIKVSSYKGRRMNYNPEYEDCRRLALEKGVAIKQVMAAAMRAYLQATSGERTAGSLSANKTSHPGEGRE